MKNRALALAPIVLAAKLFGQATSTPLPTPQKIPAIRLEVKNVAHAKGIDHNWESGYGSYDRDYFRSTELEAQVGTMTSGTYDVVVEWFFVGRQLKDKQRVLLGRGTRKAQITNGPGAKLSLESGTVKGSDANFVMIGSRYLSGSKLDGWYVRVTGYGQLLAERGSSEDLIRFCKTEPTMRSLMAIAAPTTPKPIPTPRPTPTPRLQAGTPIPRPKMLTAQVNGWFAQKIGDKVFLHRGGLRDDTKKPAGFIRVNKGSDGVKMLVTGAGYDPGETKVTLSWDDGMEIEDKWAPAGDKFNLEVPEPLGVLRTMTLSKKLSLRFEDANAKVSAVSFDLEGLSEVLSKIEASLW